MWAEPLDWEGDPEQKPIVQLTVKFKHFLADKCVPGDGVVDRVHLHPCELIQRLTFTCL